MIMANQKNQNDQNRQNQTPGQADQNRQQQQCPQRRSFTRAPARMPATAWFPSWQAYS